MSKYFVYYSATGNGDFIAEKLKEAGYTLIKVETVKPIGKMSFFKILHYGGQAMFKKKAKIKELELSLKEDDEVIIGSPIWNDRLSTPINTVLAKYDFNKDATRFIVYPAGDKAIKVVSQLAKLGFKNEPVVYSYPLKNQEKIEEVLKLVK